MKIELLAPAGNVESFYAALEAGADAIYLGLDQFNARNRAQNFKIFQLPTLLKLAHQKKTKVYVTLNTLIKNNELKSLFDFLYMLREVNVDAVIIQDWGVYYLLENFFPQIEIHASTQLANHNSIGAEYSFRKSFDRIIMARELTFSEIKKILKTSEVEVEIFVHGSLCYSFSGHCLFSSFLGGMSANRGLCKQPCRRIYSDEKNVSSYLFSLNDLQLIDYVSRLMEFGVSSLKIEGRMKPAEYVYKVVRAYRMVIDDPSKLSEAKSILSYDLARNKTGYFMSQNVNKSLSQSPFTGNEIGIVEAVTPNGFIFTPKYNLEKGDRIRVMPSSGENVSAIKINKIKIIKDKTNCHNNPIFIETDINKIFEGNIIFHVNDKTMNFPNKLPKEKFKSIKHIDKNMQDDILHNIYKSPKKFKDSLFVRINELKWLRKIYMESVDFVIIDLSLKEWNAVTLSESFLQNNINKFIIQLPLFIAEEEQSFYQNKCYEFHKRGILNFMINHVSQKLFIPGSKRIRVWASEHIYTFNDAAVKFLQSENIYNFIYPFENEIDNYYVARHKSGIVPIYFFPKLFFSRMPLKMEDKSNIKDREQEFKIIVRNGFTIVIPEIPVVAFQYKEKLKKVGYNQFLIDFSFVNPSQNIFKKLIKKFSNGENIQPSSTFNFKKGIK